MKILVVGDGHSEIHEVAVVSAFKKLGHEVESFFWRNYFQPNNQISQFWRRIENKFLIGPSLIRLNNDLLKKAIELNPELIFIYRGTHIFPGTLTQIKIVLPCCELVGYNNDDPFSSGHNFWLWRNFMNCVPLYDLIFAYRKHNLAEYINSGAKKVELLMPWFLPQKDLPLMKGEAIFKKYDVVFIGHFERDKRVEFLKRVAEGNLNFGLFGPEWDRAPKYNWLEKYQPILSLRGESYRETMISAKVALCFLSTLNRDTYTRRCFEIPAMGVFMLCQYSDDLAELFEDGRDAVFFHTPEDMMEKLLYYITHDNLREAIAANGRARVLRDNHDVVSRMSYVLKCVKPEGS